MQIMIKKVTDNGNGLEGVTMNVSVKELTTMMDNGIHLFGPNELKEPEEDFMNPPVKDKDLVDCKSVKSGVYPERQAFVKQWLRNNNIDFDADRNSVGDEVVRYSLTGDQVVELLKFLNRNECDTQCYI